jgi:hypothetical protein
VTYIDILFLMDSGLLAGAINTRADSKTISSFLVLVAIEPLCATANATRTSFDAQVL